MTDSQNNDKTTEEKIADLNKEISRQPGQDSRIYSGIMRAAGLNSMVEQIGNDFVFVEIVPLAVLERTMRDQSPEGSSLPSDLLATLTLDTYAKMRAAALNEDLNNATNMVFQAGAASRIMTDIANRKEGQEGANADA